MENSTIEIKLILFLEKCNIKLLSLVFSTIGNLDINNVKAEECHIRDSEGQYFKYDGYFYFYFFVIQLIFFTFLTNLGTSYVTRNSGWVL